MYALRTLRLAVVALIAPIAAHAQVVGGTLAGTVTDPTGAYPSEGRKSGKVICLCGECGLEREPVEHVEGEGAVWVDVLPLEGGQGPQVDIGKPPLPLFLFEHLLDHEGVDVDEADLQQMQRQHQDLLVFKFVAGELAALAIEDEAVGAVPVLDDVQPLVDLFTPTSASWLNLVERWFALLTERQLRRGVHRSTKELKAAIDAFIAHHNHDPKPFIWHKTVDQILDSVAAFCKRTNDSGH